MTRADEKNIVWSFKQGGRISTLCDVTGFTRFEVEDAIRRALLAQDRPKKRRART